MSGWADNSWATESSGVTLSAPEAPIPVIPGFGSYYGGELVWIADIEAAVAGGTQPNAGFAFAEDAYGAVPYDFSPAGGAEIIRVSDLGWRGLEADPGGSRAYPPVVLSGPDVERRMALGPDDDDTYAWGSLTIAQPDYIPEILLDGRDTAMRRLRVRAGLRGWDDVRGRHTDPRSIDLIDTFAGLAMTWNSSTEGAEIPLRDVGAWLDAPMSTRRFLGTGGVEGTSDMAGQSWPIVRGGSFTLPVRSCPAILVNPTTRVYRWTDGGGIVTAIREDGAENYTFAGSVADVHSAPSPPSGSYITSTTTGEFRLGSDPVGEITVDGIGSAGPIVVNIIRDILLGRAGLPPEMLDEGSFFGTSTVYPWSGGWAWTGEETAREALRPLLAALGARLVATRGGKLRLWPLRALPSSAVPAARFDPSNAVSIEPIQLSAPLSPPSAFWNIGYGKTHVTTDRPKETVTPAERRRLATSYRTASWASATNLSRYAQASRPSLVETALLSDIEASSLAEQYGALWGNPRRLWRVTLPTPSVLLREIGDVVLLTWPIEGLRSGAMGQVVGDGFRGGESTAALLVLV